MIAFTLSSGEPIPLKPSPVRKFKGTRLPGCDLYRAGHSDYNIILQEFDQPYFAISYCTIQAFTRLKLQIRESKGWLQLFVMRTGEMKFKNRKAEVYTVLTGQYLMEDSMVFQSELEEKSECSFFAVCYSSAFLSTIGIPAHFDQKTPRFLPGAMQELVDEILENPYDNTLRAFYYDNSIRDLLLFRLALPGISSPGQLSDADTAACYLADQIISENLDSHFTIPTLAKMAHTNAYVLKAGFPRLFQSSVFDRLLERRMKRASNLLKTTARPIKDIFEEVGYQTMPGFSTAFKKRFGLSPREWRKQNQNS